MMGGTMSVARDAVVALLLSAGALFILIGGIGIYRMPDLFSRMSATTKAATLGVVVIVLAMAVHFDDVATRARAALTIFFLFITAPVAAHMIGRAGYALGVKLYEKTIVDELAAPTAANGRPAARPPGPRASGSGPGSGHATQVERTASLTPAPGLPPVLENPALDVEDLGRGAGDGENRPATPEVFPARPDVDMT